MSSMASSPLTTSAIYSPHRHTGSTVRRVAIEAVHPDPCTQTLAVPTYYLFLITMARNVKKLDTFLEKILGSVFFSGKKLDMFLLRRIFVVTSCFNH